MLNTKKHADCIKKLNLNVKLVDQKFNLGKTNFLRKTG